MEICKAWTYSDCDTVQFFCFRNRLKSTADINGQVQTLSGARHDQPNFVNLYPYEYDIAFFITKRNATVKTQKEMRLHSKQ